MIRLFFVVIAFSSSVSMAIFESINSAQGTYQYELPGIDLSEIFNPAVFRNVECIDRSGKRIKMNIGGKSNDELFAKIYALCKSIIPDVKSLNLKIKFPDLLNLVEDICVSIQTEPWPRSQSTICVQSIYSDKRVPISKYLSKDPEVKAKVKTTFTGLACQNASYSEPKMQCMSNMTKKYKLSSYWDAALAKCTKHCEKGVQICQSCPESEYSSPTPCMLARVECIKKLERCYSCGLERLLQDAEGPKYLPPPPESQQQQQFTVPDEPSAK